MSRNKKLLSVLAVLLLAACNLNLPGAATPTSIFLPTQPILNPTSLIPPTVTSFPTDATPPSVPTSTTPAPTQTPPSGGATRQPGGATQAPAGTPSAPPVDTYLDDRSTATGLVLSYFNAINRKEYLRAYSYWEDNASGQTFAQFEQGYAATASVKVTFGQIGGDAGAGQFHYTVPLVLYTETTAGDIETFSACYILHLANPAAQAQPPFRPMGIQKGSASPAPANADPAGLLAQACAAEGPTPPAIVPIPTTNPSDITPNNYLDDRSDAVQVLRSLFNAVNRKEYARAYSYWENAGSNPQVQPFNQFAQGYAQTAAVQLLTGQVKSDAGAGQLFYTVPVVLTAQTTAGANQTFSGCYTLHMSQPAVQATPPFKPLAIRSAGIQVVSSPPSDLSTLLTRPCPPQ